MRSSTNAADNPTTWDWSKVGDVTGRMGTTWRFAPAASQWRNGVAEARVKAMKDGLDLAMPAGAENLTIAEFRTVIVTVSSHINDRPLALKRSGSVTDGELLPITPNSLLLGRNSRQQPSLIDAEDESVLTKRTKFVEEVEQTWWRLWFSQCWENMFPRGKWKTPQDNLKEGDIVMKGYEANLGKRRYVLCRVLRVFPDEGGRVRTVEVGFRPKNSREKSLPYNPKDLVKERISVQRLVLLPHVNSSDNEATRGNPREGDDDETHQDDQ